MKRGSATIESRRAKRHLTAMLSCDLGDVLDLSTTGMRIKCKSRPPVKVGQILKMKVEANGQRIAVSGAVRWVRRKGLRGYQVGVQFVNIKPAAAAALESLAKFGFVDLDAAVAAKRRIGDDDSEQTQARRAKPVRAAVDLPDYYSELGVSPTASLKEIKSAHRSLAMKFHPDVNDDPECTQRFIKITEAYDILSDARARRSYDDRRRMSSE